MLAVGEGNSEELRLHKKTIKSFYHAGVCGISVDLNFLPVHRHTTLLLVETSHKITGQVCKKWQGCKK